MYIFPGHSNDHMRNHPAPGFASACREYQTLCSRASTLSSPSLPPTEGGGDLLAVRAIGVVFVASFESSFVKSAPLLSFFRFPGFMLHSACGLCHCRLLREAVAFRRLERAERSCGNVVSSFVKSAPLLSSIGSQTSCCIVLLVAFRLSARAQLSSRAEPSWFPHPSYGLC